MINSSDYNLQVYRKSWKTSEIFGMFALTCSRWGVFLLPSELTPLPSLVLFLESWTFIIESRCWVDVNRTPDGFSFESRGGAEKGEPQAPPHLFAVTQSASVHCPTVCVFKSLGLLMTPLHQIPRAFVLVSCCVLFSSCHEGSLSTKHDVGSKCDDVLQFVQKPSSLRASC